MPISITCSQCGKKYNLRDELAGKQAKCQCGQAIAIPQAETPSDVMGNDVMDNNVMGNDVMGNDVMDNNALGDLFDGEELPPVPEGSPPDASAGSPLGSPAPAKAKKKKKSASTQLKINPILIGIVAAVAVIVLLGIYTITRLSTPTDDELPRETVALSVPRNVLDGNFSRTGYDTPEAAFAAAAWGTANHQRQAYLSAFTPESQLSEASESIMTAVEKAQDDPTWVELFKKHGIDDAQLEQLWAGMPAIEVGRFAWRAATMPEVVEMTDDLFELYAEVEDRHRAELAKELGGRVPDAAAGDSPSSTLKARMVDLQIEGDLAEAQRSGFAGGSSMRPIFFKRIDGKWFIDASPERWPKSDIPIDQPTEP